MMHTFNIITANQSAVVERLLRVTRHRGFELLSINVLARDEELNISLSVASQRPINQLFNQLDKLYDVKKIELSVKE